MTLTAIYAQLSCSDLASSTKWFTTIFARGPDAQPMRGLAEWHHGDKAGFQLFQDRKNAGRGVLTLIVDQVRREHDRLLHAGLKVGQVEVADYTTILRLNDPDGNLVVLAQHGKA
jgi:hypothetical protein